MSSLAFILNPLDHSSSNSCSSHAIRAPTGSSITPTGSAMKRPLPTLTTAVAPAPSAFAHWAAMHTGSPHEQLFHALAPLTTVAAHRLALDSSRHFAALSEPAAAGHAHKKQRCDDSATAQYDRHDDDDGAASPTTSSEDEQSSSEDADGSPSALHASKKKTRLCKEKGCTSLAVSRRSCVRHGGGSRCTFEGCTNGAKLRNRCFQHGGSTICLAAGCASKAKRYGYCWSHGGGRICSTEGCVKVAAQGGSCWAHGGGNRCKLDGCSKRSYQKHGYYCKAHASHNI